MSDNKLLEKLDGLSLRFQEVSTLITDPEVINDRKRFAKLTKEYSDLEKIDNARKRYAGLLRNIEEAREILDSENDPEMREMAREELDESQAQIPALEEEINSCSCPPTAGRPQRHTRNTRRNRWRRSRPLCRRPLPHVCQILRNERVETRNIERQRRCRRGIQRSHLLGIGTKGVWHT